MTADALPGGVFVGPPVPRARGMRRLLGNPPAPPVKTGSGLGPFSSGSAVGDFTGDGDADVLYPSSTGTFVRSGEFVGINRP